jgi:cytochrome P450
LKAALTAPANLRRAFAAARLFAPNLVLKKKLIAAYENNGTAFVTRRADVLDVLSRDEDFGVVYGPRMDAITGGENFFLGMQDTPRYARDVSNMRLAVRREDVPAIVAPFMAATAEALVAAAPGRIDVPQQLTQPAAARLLDHYFGTPGPSEAEMIDWTTSLFWYLFLDLQADPAFDAEAGKKVAAFRAWMDAHIAARKAEGGTRDDVLGRCLSMQAGGLPGMADTDIRNNLIGLLIGELPTTSAAANLALDELLDRPDALAGAQAAAQAGDDALLAAHIFEALRFRPLNPLIYRRALRDAWVAEGRMRARRIKAGTMVMASNLSAMFDPLAISSPTRFRTDRPWETYILWGYGLHACFGAHLNRANLPAILKPLLARKNLRRAAGPAGRIDQAGTPFPVHLHVEFDA